MRTDFLNKLINDLKVVFMFNRTSVDYWIKATARINKMSDAEIGYVIHRLKLNGIKA